MRLADFVLATLADRGISQAFVITGGGAMHLNDALAREGRIARMCCHHEQACAMAAEGYARVAGRPALVSVTTGPGGINALNGVFGAFTDSIPMIVISGQVKRETLLRCNPGHEVLRQLGDQEVDILRMVGGITKFAAAVDDPSQVRVLLEKAIFLATDGRPGPVWLDIPVDVQGAQVDPAALVGYLPPDPRRWVPPTLPAICDQVLNLIAKSERPVLLLGSGVRSAGAQEEALTLAEALSIPVCTAFTAHDLVPTDHPLYAGRPATVGDRPGNFAVQNSDLLLTIGSRLPIRQVGYDWSSFARAAFKVQVDIDPAELAKPIARPDWGIACEAKAFIQCLLRRLPEVPPMTGRHAPWVTWCRERVARYPAVLAKMRSGTGPLNPYHAIDRLVRLLRDDDVIVCGNATACVVTFQVAHIRRGMRLFSNAGSASMGYDLPASLGAACARGGRRVICLAGDGSLQMNIQELQTLVHHRLNIKVVVIDNGGYLSIRSTQKGIFGLCMGEGPADGVSFPDYVRVAAAYGLPAFRLSTWDFEEELGKALNEPGPGLVHLIVDPDQGFEPKASSRRLPDGRMVSAPLEDLAPFLSRAELAENLLIPPKNSDG